MSGALYVISSPAYAKNTYKVGMTTLTASGIRKSATRHLGDPTVEFYAKCDNVRSVERKILDDCKQYRICRGNAGAMSEVVTMELRQLMRVIEQHINEENQIAAASHQRIPHTLRDNRVIVDNIKLFADICRINIVVTSLSPFKAYVQRNESPWCKFRVEFTNDMFEYGLENVKERRKQNYSCSACGIIPPGWHRTHDCGGIVRRTRFDMDKIVADMKHKYYQPSAKFYRIGNLFVQKLDEVTFYPPLHATDIIKIKQKTIELTDGKVTDLYRLYYRSWNE